MMPNATLTLSIPHLFTPLTIKPINIYKFQIDYSQKKEGGNFGYLRFSTSQLPAMLIMTAMTIAMIIPISVLIAPSVAPGPGSP